MSKLTVPILIEKEGIKYKFLYFNFSEDGSIYILFPRKRGYLVKSKKDIPLPIAGKVQVSLDSVEKNFESPYITFHPGKKTIHINTTEGEVFQYDMPTLSMAEDGNLVFPLSQVILSSSNAFLDVYPEEKYLTPLMFGLSKLSPKSALSVEIWIHPVGTYIDPEDFPLRAVREEETKPVGFYKLENATLKHYTCTVFASEIASEGSNERIIVSVQNNERPYVFDLIPKKT